MTEERNTNTTLINFNGTNTITLAQGLYFISYDIRVTLNPANVNIGRLEIVAPGVFTDLTAQVAPVAGTSTGVIGRNIVSSGLIPVGVGGAALSFQGLVTELSDHNGPTGPAGISVTTVPVFSNISIIRIDN
ncbi:hypothetical protein SAMN04487866_11179 [Thermoactinomyces sp. DSM 45891]|nr:hypothetical protein SAMN04487866_11179 [Thermoactinomyces sp. DSM 45891]